MNNLIYRWSHLPTGSKVKELLTTVKWSSTTFGHKSEWPDNLLTTLSLILDNPLPMCIFWGNDYIQFFNDPYHKSIGDLLANQAFANSPQNTFGEKWLAVSSILQRVMGGEGVKVSDYFIVINGVENERFYDFSFSPIRNLNGDVLGVLMVAVEIVEREKVEEKLLTHQILDSKGKEESAQRLLSIVENAPFPIGVYEGEDLIITVANQSIMDVWGKGNNVVGKSYRAILPELENQKIFDQVYQVFATGVPFHAKNQEVDLVIDGKLQSFYFNYSLTPLYNTQGEIYGVLNTAGEVTDIHKAKLKVEESEKRFRDTVQQAPLGITILRGDDYVVEMANHNYLQLVGKSEEEFVGKPLFESLPEVKSFIEHILLDIKKTGEPYNGIEFPVTLKRSGKNELTYFNFVYHPIKEESEKLSGIMVIATEVSETVKAKHQLQKSEKHFRNMVMQSPVPMTILRSEKFVIESANRAMVETVWRRKASDVLGISILDAFPELKDQKYPDLFRKVYTSGITHREKESVALVSGEDGVRRFYLDFEFAPLVDSGNAISGIMITINDVTDKVEARLKIQENEERLNIVVSASDLGIWEYDLLENGSLISTRCNEIFGLPHQQKISKYQLVERFHPNDLGLIKKAHEKSYITGNLNYECRIIWPNKSLHWIEVKGKVFFGEVGNPERMVGTIRDITEEKNFHKQLVEREEKFRLLADSMPQMVWTSDCDGTLNYFNNAVFEFSGLPLQNLYGEGWLRMVHPDDRNINVEKWAYSILTGEDFHLEHRFRRADGMYRWQLSRAKPQRDDQGNIKMWVGSSTDIQEQKVFTNKLEKQVKERTKELNQKNIDLEKMNKELQSFAYISSHDLQEPLRKIQAFTSFVMDEEYENLTDNGKEIFNRIQNAAGRMQTLIQDLLTYSRTNTQDRVFEIINFGSLVEEVRCYLKEELQNHGAIVEIKSTCDVQVISFQFKQVLSNLISNSLKFAHSDRKPVIIITCEIISGVDLQIDAFPVDQPYNHISFSDNGIGFDPAYEEKIFELFQRLHGKSQYSGTGIGLAIVKKIVDNHNGIIKATGDSGNGARFDIYFPRMIG
ncbi:PAS domain S-box protein [uncultured Algoriphagus sp.]|uniref:PAS domain S-box protein n=1 Tax=uncultured Algoriphagus sp. TaxID=417365 RepID=UPI0030EC644D